MTYSIGIDPGWKNLGYAKVADTDGVISVWTTGTFDPSSFPHPAQELYTKLHSGELLPAPDFVHIERYVSYQGVQTAEAENILMLIGGLKQAWVQRPVLLSRAIDWKTELVKLLVRNKGFDNPSSSLDKKFSIAAAHACLDKPCEIRTDHEADAICLAALPLLRKRYSTKPDSSGATTVSS